MIKSSLFLDKKEKSLSIYPNRLFAIVVEKWKVYIKIMGLKMPFSITRERIYIPKKFIYLKKGYSFLRKWRIKQIEADLSLSDPMVNGVLYGTMRAIETLRMDQRFNVNINFLGINRLKADFLISYWEFIKHLISFFFPLFIDMKRGLKKGG